MPLFDQPDAASTLARGTVRTVVRGDVAWQVWQGHLGLLHPGAGPHLFFESPSVVRRVRTFPTDWLALDDDALMAVAEGW